MSFEEQSIGTNAASLSIKNKKRIYTTPTHHYCLFLSNIYMYSVPISLGDNYLYLVLVIKDNPIKSEMTVILDLLAYHIVNEYNLSNLTCNVSLNNKQIRILKLLARGITEKAIAIETGLCIDTIKYHKKNILKKLDSTSTIEAVIKSIKFNLIKVNEINI